MSMGCRIHYTHHIFLWCMGGIYMFAFSSLYFQIPGLYGKNGILPAALQLKTEFCLDNHEKCASWASGGECQANRKYMLKNCQKSCRVCNKGEEASLKKKFQEKFTLLWLGPQLGLDVETGMELICLVGTVLSFSILMFQRFRNKFVYITLWVLYFSVYQVGQTFLWFQWDILLLEAGFLTILVAPFFTSIPFHSRPDAKIHFWLVKWLTFRLMFQSGMVKLQSRCPTWWGLTALNWHFESQCIPTPLAWYAHQLPEWFKELSVVATYVIEIGIPFLFFAPLRSLRLLAFYAQVFLQITIILTGNYNFFNLLTITLCLSLLDDQHIVEMTPPFIRTFFGLKLPPPQDEGHSRWKKIFKFLFYWNIVAGILLVTKKLFNLGYENGVVLSKVAFSKDYFFQSVHPVTRVSLGIGIFAFCLQLLLVFYNTITLSESKVKKVLSLMKTGCSCCVAIWLFCISLVPFTHIDTESHQNIWPIIHNWNQNVEKYQIVNSYGLFRSMTGVGGRPELIIEGTNDLSGKWKEYHFLYKPGNLSETPPFVAPHQPRLDWQMWFAALGSYEHNPWFVHLIYKLLHGQEEVLKLMGKNPFPKRPPKYIRSVLYTYHYTSLSKRTAGIWDGITRSKKIKKWWKRKFSREYTNPLTKDNPSLLQYVENMKWDVDSVEEADNSPSGALYEYLHHFRKFAANINPTVFMLQLLFIPLIALFSNKLYHMETSTCTPVTGG